jgi:hypothetical protein
MRIDSENIRAYADTLVLQTAAGGVQLDYSAASLATLEALVQGSEERLRDPDAPGSELGLIVFYAGCYLGETIVASGHGEWRFQEPWWESSVSWGTSRLNPFALVRNRIDEGSDSVSFARLLNAKPD